MKTKNNLTAILIVWSLLMLFLTSCSSSKLTIQQQKDLLKIDKEMSKLWNEYEFKVDSLFIEKEKIKNLNK
tara:strand:- start:95 stop:307 length:213 start_codon:yes stop_codon:yes gene_type:complete